MSRAVAATRQDAQGWKEPAPRLRKKHNRSPWQNRIVSSGVQRADQFLANPDNYRIHTSDQESLLVEILDRVGWVQDVLVSEASGHVIDGHLRVKAALSRGEDTPVPYKVVHVTDTEEALLLSSLDPLGALARTDEAKLAELVALLPDDLQQLTAILRPDPVTQEVSFTAQEHCRVVVECEDESTQARLIERLTGEGYACHTGRRSRKRD